MLLFTPKRLIFSTMAYIDATIMLLRKNFLLSYRDSAALAITLSAAFFSMLVLYFSQISIDNGDTFTPELFEDRNPEPFRISTIPRCVARASADCYTLAYVPNDNRTRRWVQTVARSNGIPLNELKGFEDDDQLNEFLVNNPNRTQAAYIFDQDSFVQIEGKNVSFIVQFNETQQWEFPIGSTDFHSKVVVPAMIHQMNLVLMPELTNKSLSVDLSASIFPHPSLVTSLSGDFPDAFTQYGDILTFATFFLALVFFLYRIVSEKERGLRDAMILAGQTQSQHYISWCMPYIVVNVLLALLMIGFGRAFAFDIFVKIDFSIYFLTMFIFSLSLVGWTMLAAAFTKKSTSVSVVAFNLFIFGYILASSGSIVYELDADDKPVVSENVLVLREIFAIFPSTMYVRAIKTISYSAAGLGLKWESISEVPKIFPIRTCWYWMLGSFVVTLVLSMYLDNVLPSEHGISLSPIYPLLPSYWFPNLGESKYSHFVDNESDQNTRLSGDTSASEIFERYNPNVEDADVKAEREAVAAGERNDAALLIKNVSKNFLTKRFKKVKAVNDVSFSVRRNTAFALLGHNGAGKSTLFKIITTSLRPTDGDAYIYGLSVRRNRGAVRKMLGVCPQFDIFWDKLTGAEHIRVFAALKGLKGPRRDEEVNVRLDDVGLTEKADIYASNYSGGMQRRLSVAMSLTGDPKVIVLDEFSSGSDPLVRRDLWGAIERAKSGRVIFLITHSIEEAQHIAGRDQIGIMANGKLCVLGNALHLKSKFGAGYNVVVVLHERAGVQSLYAALAEACEGATIESTNVGGNGESVVKFSLPRKASEAQMLRVLEILEGRRDAYGIRDYSINSASLGEVFKSITSLSEDVVEAADQEEIKQNEATLEPIQPQTPPSQPLEQI